MKVVKDNKKPEKGITKIEGKTGRPKKEIDVRLLNELCGLQCTGEEIASVMNMNYDTLNARVKEYFNISFSEYYEQKKYLGKVSLRRKQFKLATKNATMGIWLGKQMLGQKDSFEVKNTNLNMEVETDLTIDEADRILQEFGLRVNDEAKLEKIE